MKFMILAAVAAFPLSAAAQDGMAVEDAYARASNPKAGAAFMQLANHRDGDCTLIEVRSDIAERVELHSHRDVDGVMQMRRIEEGITIPAGARHALARGGDHVMLMGLQEPLANGQSFALTLDFGECGLLEVEVPVDNDRQPDEDATGAPMDHEAMGHGAMNHGG